MPCGHEDAVVSKPSTRVLLCLAFLYLAWVKVLLSFGGYRRLHARLVRTSPPNRATLPPAVTTAVVGMVCEAIQRACVWYVPKPLCLQRSSAIALLLRRYGVSASVVIGARFMPTEAHAWVEVCDRVVNDDPEYIQRTYAIVDRIP